MVGQLTEWKDMTKMKGKRKIQEGYELVQEKHLFLCIICTMYTKEHTGEESKRTG